VPLDGKTFDPGIARKLMEGVTPLGYRISRVEQDGVPLAVRDDDGNVLTFDTCLENVEFASASAPSLWTPYLRFRRTLEKEQSILAENGHALLGVGFNPFLAKTANPHLIERELTLAIAEYFQHFRMKRRYYKDFYCVISSEQVHFNTTPEELPLIFELFTRLDWMNILLFADSPARLDGNLYLCARNELYMRSSFKRIGLVGAQRLGLKTAEEIAKSYEDACLFMRKRNGVTNVFAPTPVREYFQRPDAMEEDIRYLDLERNIVTTSYGTIEYRILCAQPFGQAFTPSAFNLGLRMELEETLALARDFDAAHEMPAPNERNRQASLGNCAFSSTEDSLHYARELLRIAKKGLKHRGFGEERMLAPLEDRQTLLDSPAAALMRAEKAGGEIKAFMSRAALGAPFVPPQEDQV
jgi:gamma-glutamylcysteine synthetase